MPFYDHYCDACKEIFEDFYSAVKDPPTVCQLCGVEGKVQRQIPAVVHGRVPLTGRELKQSIQKQSAQIKEKVRTNEDLRANIIGETAYEGHVQAQQKIKDTYKD
jgi:putative FmdB family regulatory protein